jgi:hypothetical protein
MSSYIYIFSKKRLRSITSVSLASYNILTGKAVPHNNRLLGSIIFAGVISKKRYSSKTIVELLKNESIYSFHAIGTVKSIEKIKSSTTASKKINFIKTASNLVASELLLIKKLKPQTVKVDTIFVEGIRKIDKIPIEVSMSGGIIELVAKAKYTQTISSIDEMNAEKLLSTKPIEIKNAIQKSPIEHIFYDGKKGGESISSIIDSSIGIVFSNKAIENVLRIDKVQVDQIICPISSINGANSSISFTKSEYLRKKITTESINSARNIKTEYSRKISRPESSNSVRNTQIEMFTKQSIDGINSSISGQSKSEELISSQNAIASIAVKTATNEIISGTKQNALHFLIQTAVSELSKSNLAITNCASISDSVYEIVCSKLDKSLLNSLKSVDMTGIVSTMPLPTYGWLATLSKLVVEVAIIKGATYALGSISAEVASIVVDVLSIVIGGISIELVETDAIGNAIIIYLNSLYIECVLNEM